MGNTVVKCCAGQGTVRIMKTDGNVEELEWPISAEEVMKRHPAHLVIDSTRLEKKQKYQVVGQRTNKIILMRPQMALQPGHLYILYPVPVNPQREPELSRSLSFETVPVPPQQSLNRSYSYSSSLSKKVSLNTSQSFSSPDPFEHFEHFNTTMKRRRSSVVIASDILHSFQAREEAVVDEPAVPEPKEEKQRGHGWSPSLSSIPESPAGSLRVFESSSGQASSKQMTKLVFEGGVDLTVTVVALGYRAAAELKEYRP
ncbi:hypothetical protein AXG93_1860s1280 [Marchantia polymorpha subsp. ruderalis]|uniref:DUF4228 domain-containing protein n=1 Tax=Marchantia polymorpha subsp. ruderalis TaxID=1480154 RepID=A0A176VEE7_MARPO|nr:hypothetical protein AXG93_1860s1280 [Marchantia polymorpha subsp. ruderalis]